MFGLPKENSIVFSFVLSCKCADLICKTKTAIYQCTDNGEKRISGRKTVF